MEIVYGVSGYYDGEPEISMGKRIQSSVIVFILILLWLYTIAMFIRRSRFLRTTGQRQSSYKTVLPPTTTTATTSNPITGATASSSANLSNIRRQSLSVSKRRQSQTALNLKVRNCRLIHSVNLSESNSYSTA